MGLHQTKKLCTAKETIDKMKRQAIEWENIFTNDTSDRGLISKIYRKLFKLKNKQSNLKMGKRSELTLPSKRTCRWPIDMKKFSTSLIIRELQIKTTMRHHLIPHLSEWLSSINQQTCAGKDVEKKEPMCTVGGNADGAATMESNIEFPQKITNRTAL